MAPGIVGVELACATSEGEGQPSRTFGGEIRIGPTRLGCDTTSEELRAGGLTPTVHDWLGLRSGSVEVILVSFGEEDTPSWISISLREPPPEDLPRVLPAGEPSIVYVSTMKRLLIEGVAPEEIRVEDLKPHGTATKGVPDEVQRMCLEARASMGELLP